MSLHAEYLSLDKLQSSKEPCLPQRPLLVTEKLKLADGPSRIEQLLPTYKLFRMEQDDEQLWSRKLELEDRVGRLLWLVMYSYV
jgi:hypothetical protein